MPGLHSIDFVRILGSLYRGKNWNYTERVAEKCRKRGSWFKGDGSEAVFFVDATPGSQLASLCQKEFKKSGLKIKVVERSGRSIKKTLVKSNPFKEKGCGRSSCKLCTLGMEVDCRARGVHYKIWCNGSSCTNVDYEGETSRSVEERFGGHMSILQSKNELTRQSSFLYEHIWEVHDGWIPPLKMEILGRYPGDPGLRQATEAVSIRRNKPSLNGKKRVDQRTKTSHTNKAKKREKVTSNKVPNVR